MRLWHEQLLPILDNQRLLSQHRECSALRGLGWGRKHSTVDYVFTHSPAMFYFYHQLVMTEMIKRGYKVDLIWTNALYRGQKCNPYITDQELLINDSMFEHDGDCIYPEHDHEYLNFCIELLKKKGADVGQMADLKIKI
jgi:uncharacterized protein (TIGR02328 family)